MTASKYAGEHSDSIVMVGECTLEPEAAKGGLDCDVCTIGYSGILDCEVSTLEPEPN